jgi:iron complex outermembrane recepter protein
MFEDGFLVTQTDGVSRTDLTDPHAYEDIDVVQGPSSTLYGNYATGGAIFFRTRRGADINGIEFGTDVGSFGYINNYLSGTNTLLSSATRGRGSTPRTTRTIR